MDVDTEEWRIVADCPVYEVSSLGRVRRGLKIVAGSRSSAGYRRVILSADGKRCEALVHRLVACAFIGPCPDGFQVNHKDAVRDNNVPANLEYLTPADNVKYSWRMGRGPTGLRHGRHTRPDRSARGERVNTAKLTEDDVRRARRLRADGVGLKDIAKQLAISKSQAFNITSGAQWRHVK